MIFVPISTGELIDKITILEIKLEKIKDERKLENVKKELCTLESICEKNNIFVDKIAVKFKKELKKVNLELWRIEDEIRKKEKANEFDQEFIELARSVYKNNDTRSEIKKTINLKFGSEIVEEKSY